jgi:hypothetical protein
MARMQIIADARWLSRAIANVLWFLGLLLLGVYVAGGLWWTITAVVVILLLLSLVWKVIRS